MRDDFDDICAERDRPIRPNRGGSNQNAGMWKKIALGIVAE